MDPLSEVAVVRAAGRAAAMVAVGTAEEEEAAEAGGSEVAGVAATVKARGVVVRVAVAVAAE
jgi:hypothetical protein